MSRPKPISAIAIPPPPPEQRVSRAAHFAGPDEKKGRYSLPDNLSSHSPIGYRTRTSMSMAEAEEAMSLLSLEPPIGFVAPAPVTEGELFEESSLGLLRARQSTNFRGQRQVTFGPKDSAQITRLLGELTDLEVPVLDNAAHTHIILSRPYRTAFTLLLTFVGHKTLASLLTVPIRAIRKRLQHIDDIPTIGYLQDIHLGVLAEAVEKAAIIASGGRRQANVIAAPFTSAARRKANKAVMGKLHRLCGLTAGELSLGWRVSMVAQVGQTAEPLPIREKTCRILGANLLAMRSERIQPGVNAEEKAPSQYQSRQDMDVPEELTVMAGRAAYNAFARWTRCDREAAKDLLLLDRIDVLTDGGKERLRALRQELSDITDRVVENLPLWADLPLMKALSRNAARGRKAFALAGQRIYVGGLSRPEIDAAGLEWNQAIRAVGAAAARSALVCEIMGCTEIPEGCDLLAGICLMAGPVNQNDIGKSFYGYADLLAGRYPDRTPTAMLVWTLKAKTIGDPIGNEEQLLNAKRKGALVDLRPGPHEVVTLCEDGQRTVMRSRDGQRNAERAYFDQDNFVTEASGREIPGNRGEPWPWRDEVLWT